MHPLLKFCDPIVAKITKGRKLHEFNRYSYNIQMISSNNHHSAYPYLIAGFISGAYFALLTHHEVTQILAYLWIGLYGLMFLFAYEHKRSWLRLFLGTLIPSGIASLPFFWQDAQHYVPFSGNFLAVVSAYALNSFHIAFQKDGYTLRYESLFHAVWDTIGKIFIGLCFTGLCWLILFLCAALFNLIGIHFFDELIDKNWFIIWSIPFFLSIGFYIATITSIVVRNLRLTLLVICQYLFPPLAIIGLLFIISFAFNHHIMQNDHTSAYTTFMTISGLSLLFQNGVYQDGLHENPYPRWLNGICRLFVIITPFFMIMAFLYNPYYPIDTSGFYVLVCMTVLLVYNISYSIIALIPSQRWMPGIQKTNIILAVLTILTTLIINTPWVVHQFPKPKPRHFQQYPSPIKTNQPVHRNSV